MIGLTDQRKKIAMERFALLNYWHGRTRNPMAKKESALPVAKPQELKTKSKTFKIIGKLPKWVLERKHIYAEPKLDGLRGIAIVTKGVCTLYTSGGERVVNGPKIVAALQFASEFGGAILRDIVYDGEFFTSDWNITSSLVKTQSKHPDRKKLCFRIFDTLPLDEWKTQRCSRPLVERKAILTHLQMAIGVSAHRAVTLIPIKKLGSAGLSLKQVTLSIEKFFQQCIKDGHEGSVLKDPRSKYDYKKNKSWLKLKPYYDADLKVIGVKEGKGRNKGRLGSLMCTGRVAGVKITVQVSGMIDEYRDIFWKQWKKGTLLGTIVEIKHEGVTANKAVRFPRFYRVRSDKSKPN